MSLIGPLHELKLSHVLELYNMMSSDQRFTNSIEKPIEHLCEIEELIKQSRISPHLGLIYGEDLIGYVAVKPTNNESAPGSSVMIFAVNQEAFEIVLKSLPLQKSLWPRMLWLFTTDKKIVEVTKNIWVQGPDIDGNKTFLHWMLHRCNQCYTRQCYLKRLELLPDIALINQQLAQINQIIRAPEGTQPVLIPKPVAVPAVTKQVKPTKQVKTTEKVKTPKQPVQEVTEPVETSKPPVKTKLSIKKPDRGLPPPVVVEQPAPIVVEQQTPVVVEQPALVIGEQPAPVVEDGVKHRAYAVAGKTGLNHESLKLVMTANNFADHSANISVKVGNKTQAVEKYTQSPPIIDMMFVEQSPFSTGSGEIYKFADWTYKVRSVLRNITDSQSHQSITNKSKMYQNIVQQHPELIEDGHVPRTVTNGLPVDFKYPIIFKPVGKGYCSGLGISVLTKFDEVAGAIEDFKKKSKSKDDSYVISEYIGDISTIITTDGEAGRKFHIRAYLMIFPHRLPTGEFGSIEWALWDDCKFLTAGKPYKNSDYNDKGIHDTHNKSTPRDMYWSTDAQSIITNPDNNIGESLQQFTGNIFGQMRNICGALVDIVKPTLTHYPETTDAFEVFGMDFMITRGPDYKVVLIEANDRVGYGEVSNSTDKDQKQKVATFSYNYYNWLYQTVIGPYFGGTPKPLR